MRGRNSKNLFMRGKSWNTLICSWGGKAEIIWSVHERKNSRNLFTRGKRSKNLFMIGRSKKFWWQLRNFNRKNVNMWKLLDIQLSSFMILGFPKSHRRSSFGSSRMFKHIFHMLLEASISKTVRFLIFGAEVACVPAALARGCSNTLMMMGIRKHWHYQQLRDPLLS